MSRIVKMILVSVVAIIILIVLITGSNILFFLSIFNWLQKTICIIPAMDESLAKGLAAFLVAIIIVLPLGKMILSFTPIPQKNKSLYRSLILVCVGIFFMFMYFGTEKIYFNPQTGLPMKYYSTGLDDKIKLFSVAGYDPETGEKLLPVTKEVIQKMRRIVTTKNVEILNKEQTENQASTQLFQGRQVASVFISTGEVNNPPSTQTMVDEPAEKVDEPLEKNVIESPKEAVKESIDETASESQPKFTAGASNNMTSGSIRTDFTSPDFYDHVSELPTKEQIKSSPKMSQQKLEQEIEDHVFILNQRVPIGRPVATRSDIKEPAEKVEKKERVKSIHEILTGRSDPVELERKDNAGLTGYSVSILDNQDPQILKITFEERYRGPRSSRQVCETVFDNISRGTFEVFDSNKEFLFKISPKKKSIRLLGSGCYYFKSSESAKYIPLNLPTWSKFAIKFADEKTMTPGEILITATVKK